MRPRLRSGWSVYPRRRHLDDAEREPVANILRSQRADGAGAADHGSGGVEHRPEKRRVTGRANRVDVDPPHLALPAIGSIGAGQLFLSLSVVVGGVPAIVTVHWASESHQLVTVPSMEVEACARGISTTVNVSPISPEGHRFRCISYWQKRGAHELAM